MSNFIAYHQSDYREALVPMAVAETHADAQAMGIRRVLSQCITDGGVVVIERPDLSPEDIKQLDQILSEHFA